VALQHNAFYTVTEGTQNRILHGERCLIVSGPAQALTLQLLEWLLERPRTYTETLEAWRTSCPRLSIWEDACIDGLVDANACGGVVAVSSKGRQLLRQAGNKRLPAA
jgi:hypothetical protein